MNVYVVTPPAETDWSENFGYATLEALVREAKDAGVAEGSNVCLLLDDTQAEMITGAGDTLHAWAVATRTHGMFTFTSGPDAFVAFDHWGERLNGPLVLGWNDLPDPAPDATDVTSGTEATPAAAETPAVSPDPGLVSPQTDPPPADEAGESSADSEAPGDASALSAATSPMTDTPPQAGSESALPETTDIDSVVAFAKALRVAIDDFLPPQSA